MIQFWNDDGDGDDKEEEKYDEDSVSRLITFDIATTDVLVHTKKKKEKKRTEKKAVWVRDLDTGRFN